MKEAGPFKSVVFILTLAWDEGRKSHFPPKEFQRGSTSQKRELGQSACARNAE